MSLSQLPTLNAILNLTSALLLVIGYRFIRSGRIAAHRACMLGAFSASVVFLISYITYHYNYPTTLFTGQGWVRVFYFVVLFSHIVLAVVIVPLVLVTLSRALRARFPEHRRIAKVTFPIWIYVSVTGVVVYVMLYHLYPTR